MLLKYSICFYKGLQILLVQLIGLSTLRDAKNDPYTCMHASTRICTMHTHNHAQTYKDTQYQHAYTIPLVSKIKITLEYQNVLGIITHMLYIYKY